MNDQSRNEDEVFEELAALCAAPGYLHAVAFLCFRDNTIKYEESITSGDMLQQFSMERLVRTEISTLIGLACKAAIDVSLPPPEEIQRYIQSTDALLKELHESLVPPIEEVFDAKKAKRPDFNPFNRGDVLREAIFYCGESAFHFQYRDLSESKYRKDDEWLTQNKGYSIHQAVQILTSIQDFQNDEINDVITSLATRPPDDWNLLDAYIFGIDEIAERTGLNSEIVECFIVSFVAPPGLLMFGSLDDFNALNAYPIIKLENDEFLLFQHYSLAEALYETPFFWFNEDERYRNEAMGHRGEFTERFSAERLRHVFGERRVYENIEIRNSKNEKKGEIDVLVVFADRAIVLQAKSKKLTIAARKGNDLSLQDDFKKAVQDAYDQAIGCAALLTDHKYRLVDSSENELSINRGFQGER